MQVSLDASCQATITPEMMLNDDDTSCPGGEFYVEVSDANGVIPTSPVVTGEYIGQTLSVTVIDEDSNNSCWGEIFIEDKMAPVIECNTISMACSDLAVYPGPEVTENCDPNPTIVLLNETETVLNCDPDYIKQIDRTYQAIDASGNVSNTCVQTIFLERLDFESIVCPQNYSVATQNPLACDGNYPLDGNGHPDPSYTGVPSINGVPLYPNTNYYCNTITTYSDLVLPPVGCITKIMRTWTMSEWWCGQDNSSVCVQIIEYVDYEAPTFTCPADDVISTAAGYDCHGLYLIPALTASDNCSNVVEVDVTYPGGFLDDYNGGSVVELPGGVNTITYTVYDGCGNSDQCSYEVTVEDNTPPIAVCDQNTVVSLGIDGTVHVYASTFDDGSYDECGIQTMEVRRMGQTCDGSPNTWKNYVVFCCSDVAASPVQVEFRVIDNANNINTAMVNVTVQDKLLPSIVCPADMTVSCDIYYDPEDLAATFGEATATDNCSVTMNDIAIFNLNQCNTGTITRIFTATDPNGSVQCAQVITFVNYDPFNGYTDIIWPSDVTVSDCNDPNSLHPDNTGYPDFINEDQCDMVGSDWDDKVFQIINGENACYKIVRTWTVLDWCQNSGGQYAQWNYDQIIKVMNFVDPVIDGDCSEISICSYDENCDTGFVELTNSASDDCTPAADLVWVYSIDANNDGSFDYISSQIKGGSVDASGNYPIGAHRIVWSVEDKCGNVTTCEQLFNVMNCKAPTPYCINGLAVDLMPVDQNNDGQVDWAEVTLWASDFDAGSSHQCGYPVEVSFSSDYNDKSKYFDCDDLGEQPVTIWATAFLPDGTITQDFCNTYVDIQDNNDACPEGNNLSGKVLGLVDTEISEEVSDVSVDLVGSGFEIEITSEEGTYAFPEMPLGGAYIVSPEKDNDPMNGVTTLDLVMIQKHILSLELLDSPYKHIAADINADKSISANDLLELRKMILGINENFESNTSWRFVDKKYNFQDPMNPLVENFPEEYNIGMFEGDMVIDFYGVKVGDINHTATTNAKSSETRNYAGVLEFETADQSFNAGDRVEVAVTASNFNQILGYQYTVSFNSNVLKLKDVVSGGKLGLTTDNFGFTFAEEGILTTSWNKVNAVSVDAEEVLFTLVFEAQGNNSLSGNLSMNSNYTVAEAYHNGQLYDVALNFRDAKTESVFALNQNTPNPFTHATDISFTLPESGEATLSIMDVTGKLVYRNIAEYEAGYHVVTLGADKISAAGVLYYRLETQNHIATRKMVVLK